MGRALSISSLDLVVSSAFQDHGMNAGKYFALNAAVASEAFDATLFENATNNPLVHTAWHDYHSRFYGSGWAGWGFESDATSTREKTGRMPVQGRAGRCPAVPTGRG